jgi:hypothetical protein
VILNKRVPGILCLLMTAGLLFAGLWPFDFSPKNRAYWLPGQDGLYFDGHRDRWKLSVGGIAYTPSPLISLKPAPSEKGAFTIEILLRPTIEVNNDVPHIVSLVDNLGREVFYLGQWKQWFIVRWYSNDQSGRIQKQEIGVDHALVKGKTRLLTLVSNQKDTSIYLDGELAKNFPGTALIGEDESIRGCSVLLGNSREASSSWAGSVLALKVYTRTLGEREIAQNARGMTDIGPSDGLIAAYAFDKPGGMDIPDLSGNKNNVAIPDHITVRNEILKWPNWSEEKRVPLIKDVIVNVLGFVPYGFLLALWREQTSQSQHWRTWVVAVLAGTLVSLVIEVTQAFIPARDSSMLDVVCNTAGTAIGAGLLMARKLGSWKAQC